MAHRCWCKRAGAGPREAVFPKGVAQLDHKVSLGACQDVGRAVAGDKSEGPNSPFYKALGYVPLSERKSGLGRKKKDFAKAA